MKFTDIFINKPVLATVVSLFILLLGLRAGSELNVRQYPLVENAVINVNTTYIGADADLVQGFITTPMEQEVATAEGIDYITSTSANGLSAIRAYVRMDADPDEVLTQVSTKVNKLRNQLPEGSEDPVVELTVGDPTAAMYLAFYSDSMNTSRITDYVIREVEPKLATIPGVQRADVEGSRTFAMRIWLDPERMAALSLTASDVTAALRANNVLSAVGSTKGSMLMIDLKANTDLTTPLEFEELIVLERGGAIVRLRDIARVELGSETYATSTAFSGEPSVFIAVFVAPDANSLEVIREVRRVWNEEILPQLPTGIEANIPYDSTIYIENAIDDVVSTIIEAVVIVVVVIFLFLGSLRSVLIPALAVPLSLVGALFLMLLMGFTVNLLTLLAMVLAIGIVVDDAIIVLENIHRHIEHGMAPQEAALLGARELAWPVVAMTTTLVAVYLPIGFMGGLTGTLFTEFAFTLAGAVLLSGVIALTLSPMMCAKLLKPASTDSADGKLALWLDRQFDRLHHAYQRDLHRVLDDRLGVMIFGGVILISCYFLFVNSPSELAPSEDIGFVFYMIESDPGATLEYLENYTDRLADITHSTAEIEHNFLYNGVSIVTPAATNGGFGGFVLKPWGERERSTQEVLQESIQPKADLIPGLQIAIVTPPPLPSGGGGLPVEFVVGSTADPLTLHQVSDEILDRARASGKFVFLNTNLKIDRPRQQILIDRDKAALLGIDMQTLGRDLSAMLSGGYVNRFSLQNRSYKVIPQVQRSDRLNPEQLENYYTRARSGELISLSTIVRLESEVQPQALNRFQQLNSVTFSAVPRPGVTLGEALGELESIAADVLPQGYSVDYGGESRQFKQEGSGLLITFFFALLIIYLVLAAQFESFRDPLIMLVTVPMSISGALLVLNIFSLFQFPGATLNIYTQVGLVTLIGVIAKHGILIVEFANKLQQEGKSRREAIEEAAAIRLRPVLMTTAALVLAMVPLLVATGPGAVARFSMGLVIAAGMTLGTLFTLYVLPSVYLYIGRDYERDRQAAASAAPAGAQ